MGELIKVELKDGSLCRMAPKALDVFLARNKVVKFIRSGNWAVVGLDPMRVMKSNSNYTGPERRSAA